ncbi:DUF6948 domain-containing protein [Phenylobacterium sp.]|uniref:DUF6948 domain-containing protein n=1 Tax=Phenylobacterium sp. TaxID=1871053 RepID=UPI002DF0712F|nr:hypothetical protein [Phenylobacterium sp.]
MSESTPKHLAIVVADRGWVWVGTVNTEAMSGPLVRIEGARCVRRWGTTEGLGQLAQKGPQPNTKLDTATDVDVASKAIIAILPCEPSAWAA